MTKTPRPAWVQQNLSADTDDVIRPLWLTIAIVGGILAFTYTAMGAPVTCDQRGCSDWKGASVQKQRIISQSTDAHGNAVVIGGRPAGCPALYCGCGLAQYLGIKDKRLNLAWSWAQIFPRTSAAPGMAAVRRGHVMLLQSHVDGTRWVVRDYNGGRGLSWIHVRDVRGYVFVNPNGAYAQR
jgi:hypothetical protein